MTTHTATVTDQHMVIQDRQGAEIIVDPFCLCHARCLDGVTNESAVSLGTRKFVASKWASTGSCTWLIFEIELLGYSPFPLFERITNST